MLLVKPWWDVCTEFIVRITNWRHQIQLEMENRRRQLKEPYGGKDLVSARWVLLTGFEEVSSPNGLFYSPEERKEIIYHAACVCLLSAVWPQMPTTQATFYQWPDCWRRFLVLLVIDVIKPLPMIVLLNALLDPVWDPAKCFKFFSDKHCMQVATSSTFPSANDVIELCCILYNKTSIIATSFSQRTTAFEIFFIERTYTSDILF